MANLVSLVITQLSENRANQYYQEDMLKKRIKKIQETNQKHLKEKAELEVRFHELEAQSNPYSYLNMLIALQNLGTVEQAEEPLSWRICLSAMSNMGLRTRAPLFILQANWNM